MNTTELKIRVYGDSLLRKKAQEIKEVTAFHRQVLSSMSRLMYEQQGIGLAAPQAGISQALIVADIGSGLYKLINPRIVKKEGSQTQEEGCLSVPGICLKVKRAKKICVEAMDENGTPLKLEIEDLLACVLQHEIDHLKGRLIIDYASFWDRIKYKKKLEVLIRKSENNGMRQQETKSCRLQL